MEARSVQDFVCLVRALPGSPEPNIVQWIAFEAVLTALEPEHPESLCAAALRVRHRAYHRCEWPLLAGERIGPLNLRRVRFEVAEIVLALHARRASPVVAMHALHHAADLWMRARREPVTEWWTYG